MSEKIAKLLARRARGLLILSSLAVVVLAVPAFSAPEALELGNGSLPGSESEQAAERLGGELGFDPEAAYVLLVEAETPLGQDTIAVAVRALRSQIGSTENVGRAGKAATSSTGARQIAVYLDPGLETGSILEVGEALREDLDPGPLTVSVAGPAAVSEAARSTLSGEVLGLELVVLPFVFFVLAVALGWRLGLAALLGAVLSVVASLAALSLVSAAVVLQAAAVPVAALAAFTVGLALAAALARRYREEAASMGAGADALGYSLAIVVRGAVGGLAAVAIAAAAALTLEIGVVASIGAGALLGILFAPLALLPAGAALLAGTDRGGAEALPLVASDRDAPLPDGAPRSFAAAVSLARSRRRSAGGLVAAALVLALALALHGVDGVGLGGGDLPAGDDSRSAEQALAKSFGPGASGPLLAVTDGPADSDAIERQRSEISATEGVDDVSPAGNAAALARYSVTADSKARSLAAQRTAESIRALDLEGDPQFAGPAADLLDTGSRLRSRLPIAGGLALLAAALLWALLFGSVGGAALALSAAIAPLAGAGVVAMIFSEGALEGLIGYDPAGAPDLLSPLLVVMILLPVCLAAAAQTAAALREERTLGGGAVGAVARSATLTVGPTLTASVCGLAIAIVWLGSELTVAREVAVGVAVGLALDSLVIRTLAAPGLARLLWR